LTIRDDRNIREPVARPVVLRDPLAPLRGRGDPLARLPGFDRVELRAYAIMLAAGTLLAWASRDRPTAMPLWAPWEFSWAVFVPTGLAGWWYARGLARTPGGWRPSRTRQAGFWLGLGAIYAVLQTHYEYAALHLFALNRFQHLALHHLGPFLIALAWPGPTLARGMPAVLRRAIGARAVRGVLDRVQRPVLAGVLFVGLLYLWLIPVVHLRAMLDPTLYAVMNASMVIDGILFWTLAIDLRPSPPARLSYSVRMLLALGVQVPQIVLGGFICFAGRDLYPFYSLCGRIIGITPLLDQQIGGFMVWFPAGMMSAIAFMMLLHAMAMDETRRLARG
jgi:putative membrane protein